MAVRSVVVLNDFCHAQGGASRVAIDEAIALHRLGLDVTFLGAVGPIDNDLSAAGVRTRCLQQQQLLDAERHPGALLQALWNRQAYREVQSLLKSLDRRQTIVHLHGYTKALTTTPVLAASRGGFTTICTLHDFFAACPNGAFFDYRQRQPCSLRALSGRCVFTDCDKRHMAHKAYRVARGLAQRHAARFPASVRDYITLSEQSMQLLRPYLPADSCFHALSNIINVARDQPVDAGANRHLVAVGRLDAEKGVMLAAEAARHAGLPIVFVGDGPLRDDVEATGARVTGWLTAERVREEVEHARCLVFPSLWYETFGLVVDEAAARGIPAIVSDVSAPSERIVDGETGWLYPSGDIRALESRLRLTRDAEVVRTAGAAAYRRYWSDPSDPSRHAQRLAAIYETALARNRSG
jgi:glycosyltransferase involved in cell wall biosynthesis